MAENIYDIISDNPNKREKEIIKGLLALIASTIIAQNFESDDKDILYCENLKNIR